MPGFETALDLPQITTPSRSPSGGRDLLYFKTDGLPYYKTPSGVEVPLSVGDVQTALHLNPSFETSGSAATDWGSFWQNNATIAIESTDVLYGTRSLTVSLGAVDGANQLMLSSVFTVAAGDLIEVSAWAHAVTGAPRIMLGILTAPSGTPDLFDGVSTNQEGEATTLAATFTGYSKAFTIPAGHTVCRMTFRINKAAGDATAASARVDNTGSKRTGASASFLPGNSWPKEAVRCVDTGTSLPGSTAPSTVDGVALAVGNRVLRASPSGHVNNGIYTVVTVGTGANGVWARTSDATTAAQLAGAEVAVTSGTLYGGTRWGSSFKSTDTVGSTVMLWAPLNRDLPQWRSAIHTSGLSMSTTAQTVAWATSTGSGMTMGGSNTQIVAAVAGVYYVTTSVTFQQTGGAGNIWHIVDLIHKRSGTEQTRRETVSSTSTNGDFLDVVTHGHFDALAGDTWEVVVTALYAGLSNVQANRCQFDAHRLGGLS